MKNILLIGLGNIGRIHYRNLKKFHNLNILVYDKDLSLTSNYLDDAVQKEKDLNNILKNNSIDAAIIATTTTSHKKLSRELALNKIPHLIEKPICLNIKDFQEIQNYAKKNNIFVMCGFVERFHTGIIELKKLLENTEIINYSSIRNSIPSDSSRKLDKIKFDVLIHDLDLLKYFVYNLNSKNLKIEENLESATAIYSSKNLFANLETNRISQVKRREINIITHENEYNLDLLTNIIKIYQYKYYKSSNLVNQPFIKTDESIIKIEPTESIYNELNYFLNNLDTGFDSKLFETYKFAHYEVFKS